MLYIGFFFPGNMILSYLHYLVDQTERENVSLQISGQRDVFRGVRLLPLYCTCESAYCYDLPMNGSILKSSRGSSRIET